MKRTHQFLLPIVVLFVATEVFAFEDALWEQTERLILNSEVWIPGEVQTHQLVKNGKGETESDSLIVVTVTQDPESGILVGKLTQLLENEKDRTEKSRKEVEAQFKEDLKKLERDVPFNLENPSDAVYGKSLERKSIDGIDCVGYVFEATQKDENSGEPVRFGGTVWVDPATAVPLEIESHLLDLPRKEENAEIVSLMVQRNYRYQDGKWLNLSDRQQIWVNAKFLFKKIVVYVESDTTYHDHWFLRSRLHEG